MANRDVVTKDPSSESVVVDQPTTQIVEPVVNRVVEEPAPTYVDSTPTYVRRRDPIGNTMAASAMIQTLVWAAVVIVLLVVGILVLVHYNII